MAFLLKINGANRSVDVDGDTPLLWVLRDVLGMTGTKFGCGMALCGARTVHIDGTATRSCITPVENVGKSAVTTIEAVDKTSAGAKIQRAWLDLEVVQCGYCQSGQIMSASALLTSAAGGLLTASAAAAPTVEGIPQPRRPSHIGTHPWSRQPDARWTEPRRDLRPPAVGETEKRI
jgi:isoquinoline 1-oxidoreductase subunit alpha